MASNLNKYSGAAAAAPIHPEHPSLALMLCYDLSCIDLPEKVVGSIASSAVSQPPTRLTRSPASTGGSACLEPARCAGGAVHRQLPACTPGPAQEVQSDSLTGLMAV
jgi:hypothetical protein